MCQGGSELLGLQRAVNRAGLGLKRQIGEIGFPGNSWDRASEQAELLRALSKFPKV